MAAQQSILQLVRGQSAFRPGDNCWRFAGHSGAIAAGVTANSVLFGMQCTDNTSNWVRAAYIQRVRIQYTCLVSFTTPITVGRGLSIGSISSTTMSGGTLVRARPKGANNSNIESTFANQARIASTGALTGPVGAPGFEYGYASLAALGNAGDKATFEWTFSDDTAPIAVSSGGGVSASVANFGVFVPQTFDAAGQFELVVEVDTCELPKNYIPLFP